MIVTGSDDMQILLYVMAVACPFMLLFWQLSKQIANKERTKFIFSADDYENKELFHLLLSKGVKSLIMYSLNCFLVIAMCILLQTPQYYIFAALFVITTGVLWYSNMHYSLERARKLPEEDENQ